MGFSKETWMQLTDEEKCDILNSYKGKTSKWKEDNPECSWTTATKNTNYWKDKNERFMPGLSPEIPVKSIKTENSVFTTEEVKYLKSLCKNKPTTSNKKMTLRGINKKDNKSVGLKMSKDLYNRLNDWIESDDNEYGFTYHEVISILVKNFLEETVEETVEEEVIEKVIINEEIEEEIIEETTGIEFLE